MPTVVPAALPLGAIIFIAVFVLCFGAFLLFLASRLGSGLIDPVKFESYE